MVSPGGADLPCCVQVHWEEQSQDLVSDVEGENGEGVRAARGGRGDAGLGCDLVAGRRGSEAGRSPVRGKYRR